MDFHVNLLSFFVILTEGNDNASAKSYKHVQTLDADHYEESEIKKFINGEFGRICKRKAERHPNSEQAPTKIGRFIVEPGHDLSSNPHYNMLERLRSSRHKRDPCAACLEEPLADNLPSLAPCPRPSRASGVHGRHSAFQGTHPRRPHESALPAARR